MNDIRIQITMSEKEKQALKAQADIRSMTLSDYARKKLFDDNVDIANSENLKCISPSGAVHEALTAVSCKTIEGVLLYMMTCLTKLSHTQGEDILNKCRENAKDKLKTLGYHVIKNE